MSRVNSNVNGFGEDVYSGKPIALGFKKKKIKSENIVMVSSAEWSNYWKVDSIYDLVLTEFN